MQNFSASIRRKRFSIYTYLITLFVTVVGCVYLALSSKIASKAEQATAGSIDFSTEWMDSLNAPIKDTSRLDTLNDASTKSEGVIRHVLPAEIQENTSLCFRAKHIYYNVWLGGEQIYQQELPENKLYTNSDGAVWAFIPMKSEYAGQTVEIHFQLCYDVSSAGIDNVYLGSERGFLLDVLSKKLFAIVISVFFIILAFAFMAADIPMNFGKTKNHELLYLGLISLTIGVFCFVETQVVQLFIGNERIMHILSCLALLLIPIPVILYSDEAFGLAYPFSRSCLTILSTGVFIVLTILNYLDIADYHDMMIFIHGTDVIAIFVILYALLRYYILNRKTVMKSMYSVVRIIGLAVLALTGALDLSNFYGAQVQDPAASIRVGILVFILCFGAASLNKAISAVRASATAELITTLAYSDGLTGIGNRTAYQEKIEEIQEKGTKVGIVMLDVNNLKKVNDELGHEYGDKLLKKSADFIKKAFSDYHYDSFRIGGDEFVVILYGNKLKNAYEQGRAALDELCEGYNTLPDKMYKVSIASGYAEMKQNTDNLEEICRAADALMYQNKRKMKEAGI